MATDLYSEYSDDELRQIASGGNQLDLYPEYSDEELRKIAGSQQSGGTWADTAKAFPELFKADLARSLAGGVYAAGDILGSEAMKESAMHATRGAQMAEQEAMKEADIQGTFKEQALGAARSVAQNVPLAAIGVATGGSALIPTVAMGGMTGLQKYGEMREQGKSVPESALAAFGHGATETLTEYIPMKTLLSKGKGFISRYLQTLPQELVGENIATATQDAIDFANKYPEKNFMDYLAERPKAALDTTIQTALATGAMTGAVHPLVRVAEREEERRKQLGQTPPPPTEPVVPPPVAQEPVAPPKQNTTQQIKDILDNNPDNAVDVLAENSDNIMQGIQDEMKEQAGEGITSVNLTEEEEAELKPEPQEQTAPTLPPDEQIMVEQGKDIGAVENVDVEAKTGVKEGVEEEIVREGGSNITRKAKTPSEMTDEEWDKYYSVERKKHGVEELARIHKNFYGENALKEGEEWIEQRGLSRNFTLSPIKRISGASTGTPIEKIVGYQLVPTKLTRMFGFDVDSFRKSQIDKAILSVSETKPTEPQKTEAVGMEEPSPKKDLTAEKANVLAEKPAETAKHVPPFTPKQEAFLDTLRNAEAGRRELVYNERTGERESIAVKSTFPQWIPSKPPLRSKKLINIVLDHIYDGTIPTKKNEKYLYDMVMDRLDEAVTPLDREEAAKEREAQKAEAEMNEKGKLFDKSQKEAIIKEGEHDTSKQTDVGRNKELAGTTGRTGVAGRPDIRVVGQGSLPKPREIIASGQYPILDPNQRLGVNLVLTHFEKGGKGFLLADGTGVGKTMEILVTAKELANKTGKKALIITENKQVIEGNFKNDAKLLNLNFDNIELGTYTDLRLGKVGKGDYSVVIYDEAQNLKNVESGKTLSSEKVKADHKVFATATPMDRPTGASYFMSQITGIPESEIQRRLGYTTRERTDRWGNTYKAAELLPDTSWEMVWDNIISMRDKSVKDGSMVRREYPFYGTIEERNVSLSEEQRHEQNIIDSYWKARIAATNNRNLKKNYGGQRIGELSRWLEPIKANAVVKEALQDIKDGKSVIIVAEGINDTNIKSIKQTVPGIITLIGNQLKNKGIGYASIFGTGNKSNAVQDFQTGKVQVAIATPKSGGTGINLDDTIGNRPRVMYVVTSNFSGDLLQQILGRVSRKNTKSPATVKMFFADNGLSDIRRKEIVHKKISTLQKIQYGADIDEAYGFDTGIVAEAELNKKAELFKPKFFKEKSNEKERKEGEIQSPVNMFTSEGRVGVLPGRGLDKESFIRRAHEAELQRPIREAEIGLVTPSDLPNFTPSKTGDVEKVTKWTNDFKKLLNVTGIPFKVVASHNEFPANARALIGEGDVAIAVYANGVVYLNAQTIGSRTNLNQAAFHELIHVAGVLKVLKENEPELYKSAIKALDDYRAKNKDMWNTLLKDNDFDLDNPVHKEMAYEELLARIAEQKPKSGIMFRIMQMIRKILRKLGINERYSDKDIIGNLIKQSMAQARMVSEFNKIEGEKNVLYRGQERGTYRFLQQPAGNRGMDKSLEKYFKNDIAGTIPPNSLSVIEPRTKDELAIKKIARIFKTDIVYWRDKSGVTEYINGYYNPIHPNTIFLNIDGKNPLIYTAGHELIHSLKTRNPKLYTFLEDSIKNDVTNFKEYKDKFIDIAVSNNITSIPTDERILTDLIADFTGKQFTKKEFWDKLHKRNASFTEKIIKTVQDILRKIQLFTGLFEDKKYFNDVKKAQNVLTDVLSEYQREWNEKKSEGKPAFLLAGKSAKGAKKDLIVRTEAGGQPAFSKRAREIETEVKDSMLSIGEVMLEYINPKNLPEMFFWERMFKNPLWYNHPIYKKLVNLHIFDRQEKFFEYLNIFGTDPLTDEQAVKVNENLKKDKNQYALLREWTTWVDENWNKTDEQRADYKLLMENIETFLREKGLDDKAIHAWKARRGVYDDRIFGAMEAKLKKTLEELKETYGPRIDKKIERLNKVIYETSIKLDAETNPIEIKLLETKLRELEKEKQATEEGDIRKRLQEAISHMGDLRGTYEPRERDQQGSWAVHAIRLKDNSRFNEYKELEAKMQKAQDALDAQYDEKTTKKERKEIRNNYKVIKKALETLKKEAGFERYFEIGGALKTKNIANRVAREGWMDIRRERHERLQESVHQNLRIMDISKAVEKALENVEGMDTAKRAFTKELLISIADIIKSRGARGSQIRRGTDSVQGYLTDPVERLARNMSKTASGFAKSEVMEKSYEYLGEVDNKTEPRVYDHMKKYIQEVGRNADNVDRLVNFLHGVASFKYLALNPRSALVNTIAIPTLAISIIHQYAGKKKVSLIKISKEMGRAVKDYAMFMAGKYKGADLDIIEELHKKGVSDAQLARRVTDSMKGNVSGAWAKIMEGSMIFFSTTEQLNRGATALAAYRVANERMKNEGVAEEDRRGEAFDIAADVTKRTHADYSKSNMPEWAWGGGVSGRIGQLLYQFGNYGHNYVQALYTLGFKEHNIAGFAWALLAPLLIAGGGAFPFADNIVSIINWFLRALGIKTGVDKWFWDNTRRMLGTSAEMFGRRGLVGLAGGDISGSMNINLDVPAGLLGLAGAVGGVAEDLYKGVEYALKGKPVMALEKILPTFLANPVKALRETDTGIITARGNRIWTPEGKPLMPTGKSTATKILGFRSSDQSVLQEREWEAKQMEMNYANTKNSINELYKFYLATTDQKKKKELWEDFKSRKDKFNKEIKDKKLYPEVTYITPISLRAVARNMQKPTKKEAARHKER